MTFYHQHYQKLTSNFRKMQQMNSVWAKRFFLFVIFSISVLKGVGQTESDIGAWQGKYDKVVNAKSGLNSHPWMLKETKNGNSWYFMLLCDVIDANNTMYKATKDIKYLRTNFDYILGILNAGRNEGSSNIVYLSESKSGGGRNENVDGKEVILFEGYILRYIAEYYYIVSKLNERDRSALQLPVFELDNKFMNWYQVSINKFGDASHLYKNRMHIAALWANTALFLSKITYNEKYRQIYIGFYKGFDSALRRNLKVVDEKGNSYYLWNSTFDEPFTNELKRLKKENQYPKRGQDVSHGNRVVQYVISSYELGVGEWTKNDLILFANTLKYSVYKNGVRGLPDMIDGSKAYEKSLEGTGWKQSDGWIKLMRYDKSLYPLFLNLYKVYQKKIDTNSSNLQYYSNFIYFLNQR